jgi:hypothetical protein
MRHYPGCLLLTVPLQSGIPQMRKWESRESATVARHASAAFRAFAAGAGALFHPVQFFATFRASIANSGADTADMIAQSGTAQHEIKRRLADFGAVYHESEMLGLHMFSA